MLLKTYLRLCCIFLFMCCPAVLGLEMDNFERPSSADLMLDISKQEKVIEASDYTLESQPEALNTLSLAKAVEIGLKNHIPIKLANEEVELALQKARDAKRAYFPKVRLKWKESGGTTTGEDFKGREMGIELQQTLYSGGQVSKTYAQAIVNLAVARENKQKAIMDYLFEVAQAYLNLSFAIDKYFNKIAFKKQIVSLLDVAEKQYKLEALPLNEIMDARSQVADADFDVEEIENDLNIARIELLSLLNLPNDTYFDIESLKEPTRYAYNVKDLLNYGFSKRKDYQVKKLLVIYQQYAYEITKRKDSWNIELNMSAGRGDKYFESENLELEDEYFVGIKATKPLGRHVLDINGLSQDKVPDVGQTTPTEFSSGEVVLKLWENKNSTDVLESLVNYHKAIKELEDSKKSLRREIRSGYYSVNEAWKKLITKKAAYGYADSELRTQRAKQKANQISIVQVMRAEGKSWSGKTEIIQAMADYYISLARLYKQMGLENLTQFEEKLEIPEEMEEDVELLASNKQNKKWLKKLRDKNDVFPHQNVQDILLVKGNKNRKSLGELFDDEEGLYTEKYDFYIAEEKMAELARK